MTMCRKVIEKGLKKQAQELRNSFFFASCSPLVVNGLKMVANGGQNGADVGQNGANGGQNCFILNPI